jgi:SAM-dependent methyltransferase
MSGDWPPAGLEELYDAFPRIEGEFLAALDESLHPRGPDLLYDLVRDMELPKGAVTVDVGCGEGRHSIRLAEQFDFSVIGVDPLPRHVELASAAAGPGVELRLGTAEALPLEDASVDLVWCRDVLELVADLDRAYAEFERVLRANGRALVYQMFAGDRLEPREGEWLWSTMGCAPASADPARTDAVIAGSGLRLDECIVLGTEWGEWAQEQSGAVGRRLLHASRLLRDPQRYIERFGGAAYEVMLGDCLWHVYAMIGKLERRVYLLSKV